MMFKILILQAWYNLRYEALGKQSTRDLMFRCFIDLSLSENLPENSGIWCFRQLLNTKQLLEPPLEQINTHLEQYSIIISLGSINIIDATVKEAVQSHRRSGKDSNNTRDPEAAYNVKIATGGKSKTAYGVKMHANTDGDGFVKMITRSPSNVHDSQELNKLLGKTHGKAFADSAYANKGNDKKLGKQNNKILHRFHRNTPLIQQQKQDNKQRSSSRYIVERIFGLLKLRHGLGKVRCLGLARNKSRAQLFAMSHNLKTGMNNFKQVRYLPDCYT